MTREKVVAGLCLVCSALLLVLVDVCAPRWRPEPPQATPILIVPTLVPRPTLEASPTAREMSDVLPRKTKVPTATPSPTTAPTMTPEPTLRPATPTAAVQRG